jgi:hypothetical protein
MAWGDGVPGFPETCVQDHPVDGTSSWRFSAFEPVFGSSPTVPAIVAAQASPLLAPDGLKFISVDAQGRL